ncbi:MAG: HlyD family efflux transporter periplasmic adaptor subunit [Lachnospiraceae bacterium]|nr:HlyD family efflux transporter periplasmic adaptor subunit [Lachnospiraceae bacterium]
MSILTKLKGMKKKTKRLILMGIALIGILAAASYTVFVEPLLTADTIVYMEKTVESGDFTVGVTESGTVSFGLESVSYNLDLSTDTNDEVEDEDDDEDEDEDETLKYLVIDTISVAVGQTVTEGDVLLSFAEASVEAVRKKLTAYVTESRIAVDEAQTEYNLEAISAKEDYDLSVAKAGTAGAAYTATLQTIESEIAEKKAKITNLQVEIQNLEASIEDAEEEIEEAEEDYEEAKGVYDTVGAENQHVRLTAESSYKSAKEAYTKAKEALEKIYESIEKDQEEITSLTKEIENLQSRQGIDQLEASQEKESAALGAKVAGQVYSGSLSSLEEEVEEAKETLTDAEYKLSAFEEFVGDGNIYAIATGVVTAVNVEEGDKLEDTGELLSYADNEQKTISVDVSQEDITALTVGDSVEIVFTAYEEETYSGVIAAITMSSTSSNSTTVSYPVTIQILGDTAKLYAGMTADVTFVTDSATDTLYISRSAIVEQNEKTCVYIKKNGDYVLQQVTCGLTDGTNVQILDGLSAGETYYIQTRVSASASSKEGLTP